MKGMNFIGNFFFEIFDLKKVWYFPLNRVHLSGAKILIGAVDPNIFMGAAVSIILQGLTAPKFL